MGIKGIIPIILKKPFVVGVGILLSIVCVIALAGFLVMPDETSQHGITDDIRSYSGYTRVIEQPEYDFYASLAQRELDDKTNSELLAQKTKQFIQTANAQFYLANQLGLYQPYSFENMQEQMKHENARRKMDKEKGLPIYGPETFDIVRYYQYVSSNLEVDIIDYLATHADERMVNEAENYFIENIDKYDHREQIVYVITENGEVVEHTVDWKQLSTLEKADSQLGEFLRVGDENQTLTYNFGNIERQVKIQSMTYVSTEFEQHKTEIVSDYLRGGQYKRLLREVELNNPVEFVEIN
ncbi:hypothetical protein [Paenibacillus sp. CMAA1364]